MNLIKELEKVKVASAEVALLTDDQKNAALLTLGELIMQECDDLIKENEKDLHAMMRDDPMFDRLLLTKERLSELVRGLEQIAGMPGKVGVCLERKTMNNGLIVEKVLVPMGVVAVIYEARPNVTIDVFAICFKSGNACVLKGGKEAYHSNVALTALIKRALTINGVNVNAIITLMVDRSQTELLLRANGLIDVCIPRGSKSLIDFVRQKATIPVIETGAGVVHLYFDSQGDINKGKNIIGNAKTRRVSVCNALDCLLIHDSRLKDLPFLLSLLVAGGVQIFADSLTHCVLQGEYPAELLCLDESGQMWGKEFLSHKMSIKAVGSMEEAIKHISIYSSQHSEGIITEDNSVAETFVRLIDAAVVYVNASTAFTDGGEFGLGAEIGISTQKLHARGPMGLEALTTYKWVVRGDGHIR